MPAYQNAGRSSPGNARVVEHVLLADLKSDPNHARHHPKTQIRKLMKSIEAFDFPVPVLVDEANVIVDGHAVVEAARELGLKEIPVLRVENLSEAKKRALRLTLNRLAEDARWDRERLAIEIEALVELDVDLELTGFETTEIDLILDERRVQSADQPDADDIVPESDSKGSPVSKPGRCGRPCRRSRPMAVGIGRPRPNA